MRLPQRFKEAWFIHLTNLNSGAAHVGDKEPTAVAYGLSDWEANAIKKQVDQEINAIKKDK